MLEKGLINLNIATEVFRILQEENPVVIFSDAKFTFTASFNRIFGDHKMWGYYLLQVRVENGKYDY